MTIFNFIFLAFLLLLQIHQILKNYYEYKKTGNRKNKNLVWFMIITLLITFMAMIALIFNV